MFANRPVSWFYGAYEDRDAAAFENATIGDAELRKLKAAVREYVDRRVCINDFLETEVVASHFTAAYRTVYDSAKQVSGGPVPGFDDACRDAVFEWDTWRLAEVLYRHGDMRGNILGTNPGDDPAPLTFDDLMKRYNWYNTQQHSFGSLCTNLTNIYTLLRDKPDGFNERIEKQWLAVRYFKKHIPQSEGAPFGTMFDSTAFKDLHYDLERLKSNLERCDFILTETGKVVPKLVKNIKEELDALAAMDMDEPLTLFDIALLGGLNPRTYAVEVIARKAPNVHPATVNIEDENPPYHYYHNDDFFEKCMTILDTKVKTKDEFSRDMDLGLVLFTIPVANRSVHPSYTNFVRNKPPNRNPVPPNAQRMVHFGAAAKSRYDGERDEPQASAREREFSGAYGEERTLYARGGFDLEHYCLQCLERGVELYIRLTHAMVEADLGRVKGGAPGDDFMRAFAKLIGLTIQRAELLNPRNRTGSVAASRQGMRKAAHAAAEARCQLAAALGVTPRLELEGYTYEGGL